MEKPKMNLVDWKPAECYPRELSDLVWLEEQSFTLPLSPEAMEGTIGTIYHTAEPDENFLIAAMERNHPIIFQVPEEYLQTEREKYKKYPNVFIVVTYESITEHVKFILSRSKNQRTSS